MVVVITSRVMRERGGVTVSVSKTSRKIGLVLVFGRGCLLTVDDPLAVVNRRVKGVACLDGLFFHEGKKFLQVRN